MEQAFLGFSCLQNITLTFVNQTLKQADVVFLKQFIGRVGSSLKEVSFCLKGCRFEAGGGVNQNEDVNRNIQVPILRV